MLDADSSSSVALYSATSSAISRSWSALAYGGGRKRAGYLPVSVFVECVCLNAREAVMTGANGMHGLVIAKARNRVDAVAGLSSLGVVHLGAASVAGVLFEVVSLSLEAG
jgi:hypothetical protein